MSYISCDVAADWPATAYFTAPAETSAAITNTSDVPLYFVPNPTRPNVSPYGGLKVTRDDPLKLTLLAGETVWLAAPDLGSETVAEMALIIY